MPTADGESQAFRKENCDTGDQFVCEDATYTITSGTIKVTVHEGTANNPGSFPNPADGEMTNANFTITVTPRHVMAADGTDTYHIRGAFWAGAAFNANTGGMVFTVTDHFQIIKRGTGTVDSVQVTFHMSPNGNVIAHDFGTCASPA